MIDFLFDQYQRYKNVADVINSMRDDGEHFEILEVGANEHRNLEKFLSQDTIKYLDIELPEELQMHPDYILGDATKMEFPDDHFDIVVALDVFEHIPPDKRDDFISELDRVSKEFFVITAPFASPLVSEAERRANAVYKSLFREDFRWLAEHFENGLPSQNELNTFLLKLGLNYRIISHGSLPIWESMMEVHFMAAYSPELYGYRAAIDRFYNSQVFEVDYTENSYRKIYIASRNRRMSELIEKRSQLIKAPERFEELERLKGTFSSLASVLVKNKTVGGSEPDKIQVFVDSGSGFNEEESFKVGLYENQSVNKFLWNYNRSEPITALRIDPSDYKGIFKIENLTIRDLQGELVEALFESGNYLYAFDGNYGFSNDDPFLILSFPDPISIFSISFDVISLTKDERRLLLEIEKTFLEANRLQENKEQILEESDHRKAEIHRLNEELHQLALDKEKMNQLHQQQTYQLEQSKLEVEQLKIETEQELKARNVESETLKGELSRAHQELQNIYSAKYWKVITVIKKIIGR
ncbi:methyltransferase domain-containing protein [Paenibacillus sp. NPDC056933]|uniref:class I SAM-dependent methyltransferase n=1 Tax=Paenibacillus sp. NPDC056933 TaxID=3345968 RepID=UPI0036287E78